MNTHVLIHCVYTMFSSIDFSAKSEKLTGAQLYELRGKVAEKECLRSFRDGPKSQIEENQSEEIAVVDRGMI